MQGPQGNDRYRTIEEVAQRSSYSCRVAWNLNAGERIRGMHSWESLLSVPGFTATLPEDASEHARRPHVLGLIGPVRGCRPSFGGQVCSPPRSEVQRGGQSALKTPRPVGAEDGINPGPFSTKRSFAPPGLCWCAPGYPGLAPWATLCRAFGPSSLVRDFAGLPAAGRLRAPLRRPAASMRAARYFFAASFSSWQAVLVKPLPRAGPADSVTAC